MNYKKLKDYTHSELQTCSSVLFQGITLVSAEHNFTSAYLHIDEGKIKTFGEGATPDVYDPDLLVIDASDYIVTPSFINAHSHVAMNMFRDLAHQQKSMIYKLFFPWEKKLDPQIITALSYPYILSGLLSGTSTFADHYYFEEGIIKAFDAFGVKAFIGETMADINGPFPGVEKWQSTKKLIENWPYDPTKFLPVVAPHACDSVSKDLLRDLASFAKNNNLPLHMHLSQTAQEREFCQKNYQYECC